MSDENAEHPVRPDIWGPTGAPVSGRPLDLSGDPDRVQPDGSYPMGETDASTAASRRFRPGVPLDPAGDPDRVRPGRPLDPAGDPDRVGRGRPGDRTLTDLLGEGAQEDERDNYTWAAGLLAVLVFLALVAFVAARLGPA